MPLGVPLGDGTLIKAGERWAEVQDDSILQSAFSGSPSIIDIFRFIIFDERQCEEASAGCALEVASILPWGKALKVLKHADEAADAITLINKLDGPASRVPRALPSADVAIIGKVDDLGGYTLRPGERTLLNQLPNRGSPKLNYIQNDRVLRTEMSRGVPIRDVSVDPVNGALRNNTGFLRAERNILESHDWVFDPKSGYWYPPGL